MDPEAPSTPPQNQPASRPQTPPASARRRRPSGVSALAILSVILGVLGLFGGVSDAISLIGGVKVQQTTIMAQPEPLRGIVARQAAGIQQINERFKPLLIIVLGLTFALSGGLVWGGLLCLKGRAEGRKLLRGFLWAGVAGELAIAAATIPVQMEKFKVTRQFVGEIVDAQPDTQATPQIRAGVKEILSILSLVFPVLWIAGKIVFYLVGARYLARPYVVSYFEGTPLMAEVVSRRD